MRSHSSVVAHCAERPKATGLLEAKVTITEQQNLKAEVTTLSKRNETPKRLHVRRRQNGSPIIPIDPNMPTKIIYLIRHGQSEGQVAKKNGLDRKTDLRLRDCCLTAKGEKEAENIRKLLTGEEFESIQLVLSSPLSRALHTALLAFPTKDILVHFDLREVGCNAPENSPRAMNQVLDDLQGVLNMRDQRKLLDTTTLKPKDWPRDCSPQVIKKERIRRVFDWIYQERDEMVFAVVCHHNVIRSAVTNGEKIRPMNGIPIRCSLYSNGDLVVNNEHFEI